MIPEIRLLAAKTSRENDNLWLPLYMMSWRFQEKREYD